MKILVFDKVYNDYFSQFLGGYLLSRAMLPLYVRLTLNSLADTWLDAERRAKPPGTLNSLADT